MELEELVDDVAHLSVPTRFLCSWVQSNYADKILAAFTADAASITRLHFTVRVNGQSAEEVRPARRARGIAGARAASGEAVDRRRRGRSPPRAATPCRARRSTPR
jgi:chromosomal replication initiation ATPase DnaA